MNPTIEAPSLATLQDVSPLPIVPSLVTAIELTTDDSLLASVGYETIIQKYNNLLFLIRVETSNSVTTRKKKISQIFHVLNVL